MLTIIIGGGGEGGSHVTYTTRLEPLHVSDISCSFIPTSKPVAAAGVILYSWKKKKIYHALGCSLCQCITKSSYISMRVFQYPSALCLLLGAEKVYPSPGKELRHPGSGLDNNNNNNEILIKREPQVYTRARRSVQKKRERRRRRRPGQHNSNNKLIHWQHTGIQNLHSPSPPPHTHIPHSQSNDVFVEKGGRSTGLASTGRSWTDESSRQF